MAQRAQTAERSGAECDGADGPIVLFDGVCNLCDAAVRFIIERDPRGKLRFAALQSDAAARLLGPFGDSLRGTGSAPGLVGDLEPGTFYLLEAGRLYRRSTAALRVARHLRAPWPLAGLCLAVPVGLRDAVYDLVAKRRYAWFGKRDACRLPTPEEAGRFL